ncbi:hypothetical protein ACFX2B_014423 [Malus domestica]
MRALRLLTFEENAMEEEIPKRITENCRGSNFIDVLTLWVSMNSESCFMYQGQFLLKPTLKACRRVPISSSLSIFFWRDRWQSGRVDGRSSQLVAGEIVGGDVRTKEGT